MQRAIYMDCKVIPMTKEARRKSLFFFLLSFSRLPRLVLGVVVRRLKGSLVPVFSPRELTTHFPGSKFQFFIHLFCSFSSFMKLPHPTVRLEPGGQSRHHINTSLNHRTDGWGDGNPIYLFYSQGSIPSAMPSSSPSSSCESPTTTTNNRAD